MSNLTTAIQSIKSEVKIDSEGRVSMTRSGVCTLLGISRSLLSAHLWPQKLVESLAASGFDSGHLKQSDALPEGAVACIISYYAFDARVKSEVAQQLFKALAAVGLRAFFQSELGWQPPAPQPNSGRPDLTQLQSIINAAQDALNARKAAEGQPGTQNILEALMAPPDNQLDGFVTLQEFLDAEYPGVEFTFAEMCHIGRGCAQAHRATYGRAPGKHYAYIRKADGTKYPRQFPKYPVSFKPQMQNVVELSLGSGRLGQS